ncbi:MAG: 4'-phosphopantetheinyl transferase superfamily protein [Psychroserpens sp.]|uniref:4'-phosphopantetheinyl transferase family protein n=1 Tax=Psychroserpens sp. TaxID=2020870 RepID=UPI00300280A2
MIGNDIVDLKYISSNWQRPRFLEKVFTKKEQNLILISEHQHQMIWLLWSMKEAAYKIHVQQFGKRFFNPKRLVCELISEDKGNVKIDNNSYYTNSIITEDYIYTIAKQDQDQDINSSVFKTENPSQSTQSNVLKQRLLKSISERKELAIQNLEINKTAIGVPEIYDNSVKLTIPLSLTHCGRFSGFAYH